VVVICLLAAAVAGPAVGAKPKQAAKAKPHARAHAATPRSALSRVKTWVVEYRAHAGERRKAYVVLPAWYGKGAHPRIAFVISPHGRGVSARANARLWGALPARGGFGVISPDGAGRKLERYSWGARDQIADLARMPEIARRTLPWLRIDGRRIYAVGGSMGGQETLLLLARYPRMLAGAAAFDSVADFARQYRSFPAIPCDRACVRTWHGPVGKSLQGLAKEELGGTPRQRPGAYEVRSPMTYVRSLAFSCVPLQIWWSVSDRIVVNQTQQSGALYRTIVRLNPRAPVQAFVGYWNHSHEMQARTRLPVALAEFGLLPTPSRRVASGMHVLPQPAVGSRCDSDGASRFAAGVHRTPGH